MRLIFVSQFQSSVNETGSHQAKHMHTQKPRRSRENSHVGPHHSSSNAVTAATPTKQHFCFETQQHSTWEVQQSFAYILQGSTVQLGTLKIFWKEMPNLLAPLEIGVERRSWLCGNSLASPLNKSYRQCSIKRHRNFTILSGFSTACF